MRIPEPPDWLYGLILAAGLQLLSQHEAHAEVLLTAVLAGSAQILPPGMFDKAPMTGIKPSVREPFNYTQMPPIPMPPSIAPSSLWTFHYFIREDQQWYSITNVTEKQCRLYVEASRDMPAHCSQGAIKTEKDCKESWVLNMQINSVPQRIHRYPNKDLCEAIRAHLNPDVPSKCEEVPPSCAVS